MKESSLIHDYTEGAVTTQLIMFSLPFVFSNFLQTAYNLADMLVVGHFAGAVGMSAVSIGGEIIHFYTFIAIGFCAAAQIIISQYIGLGDRRSVAKTIGTTFTLLFILALAITATGLCINKVLMRFLHVPPESVSQCLAYTTCCTAGSFFIFGYNMISSVLRGMGDSKHPMLFIAIATILNVFLDIVFVGSGMGALGAAMATVLSQGVSFIISIVFLYCRREAFCFDFRPRSFRPLRNTIALLLKLGIPMTIQSIAISISSLVVTGLINEYGLIAAAVNGVGTKLSGVVNIVSQSLGHAGATMIGQNFSARKFERVRRIQFSSYGISVVFALVFCAILFVWPEQVFSLFNKDPGLLAMSRIYMPFAIINVLGSALRGPAGALCNGLGFVAMNFTLGILDGVVIRIGLSLLLGHTLGLGIVGYWCGSSVAGLTFFAIMFPYLLCGTWKKRKPPVTHD